ncbi:MAG TPA: hypothetical protein VE861_11080, partial [Gemmatimonadaceae bacterium]|nr:hypothetical protein [Gemmatimonadaceae bacterium]
QLIDTASGESTHDELPLLEGILSWQIDGGSESDPEALAAFVEVESVFYPQLGAYYATRLVKWCTEQLAE